MRLHVVSVPHTSTTKEFSWCAFSSLTRKFATMMSAENEVYLYAGPENDALCTEHINCQNDYEWTERTPEYDSNHPGWQAFAQKAIYELGQRFKPGDIICLSAGYVQDPIIQRFPDATVVEFIAGYQGVSDRSFRVWPSHAWQSAVYGHQMTAVGANGRLDDIVIPHFIDESDSALGEGGDYLLYVGRFIARKGLAVARDVSERTGIPLVAIGFGPDQEMLGNATFLGVLEPEHRAQIMGGALAVLMPTLYVEPFGLVAIEAQACGTPVITTDFGAFPETNLDSRFRCHSIDEFARAVKLAPKVNRERLRNQTLKKYSTVAIAPRYQAYLGRIAKLPAQRWLT